MSYFETRLAEIKAEQAARQPMIDARLKEEKRLLRLAEKRNCIGYVYFFRNGNQVKIGFTTNPKNRESTLRTVSSGSAFMARYIEGTMADEARFHARFDEYRTRGEWFDLRGKLAKYLERHIYRVKPPKPVKFERPEIEISL